MSEDGVKVPMNVVLETRHLVRMLGRPGYIIISAGGEFTRQIPGPAQLPQLGEGQELVLVLHPDGNEDRLQCHEKTE